MTLIAIYKDITVIKLVTERVAHMISRRVPSRIEPPVLNSAITVMHLYTR